MNFYVFKKSFIIIMLANKAFKYFSDLFKGLVIFNKKS